MCFDNKAEPPIAPICGGAESNSDVILTSKDGTRFRTRFAQAKDPSGAGIVILPDVRGLHPFYEQLAERFAENGVDAIALDYFGRSAGLSQRDDDFDWQTHVALAMPDAVRDDVSACLTFVRSSVSARAMFTVGFCFGGSTSFLQADNHLDLAGVIGFYGRPGQPRWPAWPAVIDRVGEFECPVLGLFGGADEGIPQSAVDQFERALTAHHIEHELVVYPGAPHSFFDRRQVDFAKESAEAWRRVLDFIARHSAGRQ